MCWVGVVSLEILTAAFRASVASKKDPIGADACRNLLIAPTFDALDGNERPPLALSWPLTANERGRLATSIVSHCDRCALCPKLTRHLPALV